MNKVIDSKEIEIKNYKQQNIDEREISVNALQNLVKYSINSNENRQNKDIEKENTNSIINNNKDKKIDSFK